MLSLSLATVTGEEPNGVQSTFFWRVCKVERPLLMTKRIGRSFQWHYVTSDANIPDFLIFMLIVFLKQCKCILHKFHNKRSKGIYTMGLACCCYLCMWEIWMGRRTKEKIKTALDLECVYSHRVVWMQFYPLKGKSSWWVRPKRGDHMWSHQHTARFMNSNDIISWTQLPFYSTCHFFAGFYCFIAPVTFFWTQSLFHRTRHFVDIAFATLLYFYLVCFCIEMYF